MNQMPLIEPPVRWDTCRRGGLGGVVEGREVVVAGFANDPIDRLASPRAATRITPPRL